MGAPRAGQHTISPPITALGRLRIAVRLTAMLLLLLGCIALYYLWRIGGWRNPWPRIFLGGVAWVAGVDVTVEGARQGQGTFLLANHVSWIDIPALAGASGSAFVGHDGLAAIPLLRWLCEMNDTVFVARHDPASVARQVAQVREALYVSGRACGALTIFPEGTSSDGAGLLPFKSSLLSALDPLPEGIDVQPVWLDYDAARAEIAWIGEEHGLDNFRRILARARPITLTIRFLPPLTGEELANRKTIAAAAREAILRTMAKA
jgi:1-acyl-sn-glycerol-3-phosphate acyltransferase